MSGRHRLRRLRRHRRGCALRGRERWRGVRVQREQGRRLPQVQPETDRHAILADDARIRYLHLGTPRRRPGQLLRRRRGRLSIRRGGPAEIRAGRGCERDVDVSAGQVAAELNVLPHRHLDVLRGRIRTSVSA